MQTLTKVPESCFLMLHNLYLFLKVQRTEKRHFVLAVAMANGQALHLPATDISTLSSVIERAWGGVRGEGVGERAMNSTEDEIDRIEL